MSTTTTASVVAPSTSAQSNWVGGLPPIEPGGPQSWQDWAANLNEKEERLREFYASCYREGGFEPVAVDDSGITMHVHPEQNERWEEVKEECWQQVVALGLDVEDYVPSDLDLRFIYEAQVASYDCLVEAGFRPEAPPTFDSWAVKYRAVREMGLVERAEDAAWDPYVSVIHDFRRATAACPQPY